MGTAGVEPEEGITLDTDMWAADECGTAVAHRDWRPTEYIWAMRHRLGVTVEEGAEEILMRMPTNHMRLMPRAKLVATHRVWGPENQSLGPVLGDAKVRWECDEIPDIMLPAACMEAVRQWKDRKTYTHLVLAHKPQWVSGYPSWLYFRLTEKCEPVLSHTCVRGQWHLPGTLFVFALSPRRR